MYIVLQHSTTLPLILCFIDFRHQERTAISLWAFSIFLFLLGSVFMFFKSIFFFIWNSIQYAIFPRSYRPNSTYNKAIQDRVQVSPGHATVVVIANSADSLFCFFLALLLPLLWISALVASAHLKFSRKKPEFGFNSCRYKLVTYSTRRKVVSQRLGSQPNSPSWNCYSEKLIQIYL